MVNRYKRWNCALNGKTNIGCGINALTFIDLIPNEEGQKMVDDPQIVVPNKGTTFTEMMRIAKGDFPLKKIVERSYKIDTEEDVENIFTELKRHLGNDSCTAVKLTRYGDNDTPKICNGNSVTSGHSVVFATDNDGKLYCLDPQTADGDLTKRKPPTLYEDAKKIFLKLKSQCYVSLSVMFIKKHKKRSSKSIKAKKTGLPKSKSIKQTGILEKHNNSRRETRRIKHNQRREILLDMKRNIL